MYGTVPGLELNHDWPTQSTEHVHHTFFKNIKCVKVVESKFGPYVRTYVRTLSSNLWRLLFLSVFRGMKNDGTVLRTF